MSRGRETMLKLKVLAILATAATMGAGCARYTEGTAAGDVILPADAAKTVVLHVDNTNTSPMELRTIVDGRSTFVGSVGGNDATDILLDPMIFPTGFLYVVAIPADGQGRAIAGPLTASKGSTIRFSVLPALDMSRAIVVR
jgi:hypothetical protein